MMKIYGTSDLHLDINKLRCGVDKEMYKDHILLLAGDNGEIRNFETVPKYIEGIGGVETGESRCHAQLRDICEAFKHVFTITGNHEYYSSYMVPKDENFVNAVSDIPNLTVMHNEVIVFENKIRIIATTLWTDMNSNDPMVLNEVGYLMNDYRYIRVMGMLGDEQPILRPKDTTALFEGNYKFIRDSIAAIEDDIPTIVMTHHAPTFQHANPQRTGGSVADYAYAATVMEDFIVDTGSKVKVWFHGHTHDQKETEIGETRVLTYARGYEDPRFDPVVMLVVD